MIARQALEGKQQLSTRVDELEQALDEARSAPPRPAESRRDSKGPHNMPLSNSNFAKMMGMCAQIVV